MNNKQSDRRKFVRFEVPGAFLSYRRGLIASLRKKFTEAYCPIQNMSRGGVKILCKRPFRPGSRLSLSLNIPEDNTAMDFNGRVVWILPIRDRDFAFTAGIQFVAGPVDKIRQLEMKYAVK